MFTFTFLSISSESRFTCTVVVMLLLYVSCCVMACGRIRLSSRKLYEIITLIWLIGRLNDVKLTAKDGDVSTEDFGYLSNKVWINFQRPKFITNTPAEGASLV